MMPQLDGLALINLLKNLKSLRREPKYVLTGMFARDSARTELDAPDAFLRGSSHVARIESVSCVNDAGGRRLGLAPWQP
jgi:response regulator RpfG family c-di-GMP phosphodiesterase